MNNGPAGSHQTLTVGSERRPDNERSGLRVHLYNAAQISNISGLVRVGFADGEIRIFEWIQGLADRRRRRLSGAAEFGSNELRKIGMHGTEIQDRARRKPTSLQGAADSSPALTICMGPDGRARGPARLIQVSRTLRLPTTDSRVAFGSHSLFFLVRPVCSHVSN